jgi:uncharacterized membrane protein YbhN (UPF0104 family)
LSPPFDLCEDTAVTKNRIVYIAVSLLLSIILIAFLLSKVEIGDISRTLRHIYGPALLVYVGVGLLATWLRTWRYKRLLQPQAIRWTDIFLVTFIRNSLDDLLPARIGSLSYIYVLNKRFGFSFESATSSFVVAFVLDFLTLSPFVVLAILFVGFGTAGISTTAWLIVAAVYFLALALLLWKIVPLSRFLVSVFRALLHIFKAGRSEKARLSVEKLDSTIDRLAEIRSRKIFVPLFLVSLLIRLGKYVSLFALLFALLRGYGFALNDLSFWKTILAVTGAEMTSALPIKGIADFGTWESAWVLALCLMAFDGRLALLSGIGIHLITNLWEYGLGFLSLLVLAAPFLKKSKPDSSSTPDPGK